MKAQRTTTTRSTGWIIAQSAFDLFTAAFGAALVIAGLAIAATTPVTDPLIVLSCITLPMGLLLLGRMLAEHSWRRGRLSSAAARAHAVESPADTDTAGLSDVVPARVWLLEDGDEPVGIALGLLPQIYGVGVIEDLAAALWLTPAGVTVRVSYRSSRSRLTSRKTLNHYVIEGSITDHDEKGSVVIDGWPIGRDDTLTGLVLLADHRTHHACEQDRTPPLLAGSPAGSGPGHRLPDAATGVGTTGGSTATATG
jgi:hypothetical protein